MEIGGFNISIFPIHIWYTNTKFPYFQRFRKIVLFFKDRYIIYTYITFIIILEYK